MQPIMLYKKFLCVFMSLMIVFISTQSAFASVSVGGWTALDTITAGATNTINAVKGAGATGMRSAVSVAPSAVKVGKHLIKGGGAAALAFAMVELADGAIDWVLDPANNSVRYTVAGAAADWNDPSVQYYWQGNYGHRASTADAAGQATGAESCKRNKFTGCSVTTTLVSSAVAKWDLKYNGGVLSNYVNRYENPAYVAGTPSPSEDKHIPIDTVASKVISNAEAGHAPSQEAVKATALEGFAAGEHDAALDAAAVPDTGVENPPDTNNPPTDTPKPFDPSSILSALAGISSILAGIMSALTGFVDWWQAQWDTFSTAITDFTTWVRAEPDTASLQPEPVEVTEGVLVDGWQDKVNAGYVNLGATQCPSDVLIPISYMGASTNLSISYVPFCHFASIIRYAVIMGAWIAALMIISGGRTKE